MQAYEYGHAAFSFAGNIYGATFFMATGFHGFHVLVGTIFLLVCLFRAYAGHFTPTQHLGFEFAAWYWHFVDVVWLFLFICHLRLGPRRRNHGEGRALISELIVLQGAAAGPPFLFPSPLVGEGGSHADARRVRGKPLDSKRPLIRHGLRPRHLLPQGRREGTIHAGRRKYPR